MSVSVPTPPTRQLPHAPGGPILTVPETVRARRPSTAPQSAHPDLPSLGLSSASSPASSSSSVNNLRRPGILRSVSTTDARTAWSPTTAAANVQFAPLPEIAPRKRRSTRSLGLAARGEMLRAQAERRQQRDQQQEQDLAWQDIADLVKDASKLLKRVVGGKSKKKDAAAAPPVAPAEEGQPGNSTAAELQAALEHDHSLRMAQQPPDVGKPDDHDLPRSRSPAPHPPLSAADDDDDEDTTEPRDSQGSDDSTSTRPSVSDAAPQLPYIRNDIPPRPGVPWPEQPASPVSPPSPARDPAQTTPHAR